MFNRIRHLKVKIKSLAAEAKIIRLEELRSKGTLRESLYRHRIDVVRYEARHAQIAYGFLRGRSYSQIEKNAEPFKRSKVLDHIERFGPVFCPGQESKAVFEARVKDNKKRALEWLDAAVAQRV